MLLSNSPTLNSGGVLANMHRRGSAGLCVSATAETLDSAPCGERTCVGDVTWLALRADGRPIARDHGCRDLPAR